MRIVNVNPADTITSLDGKSLQCQVYDIGNWDMDTNQTTTVTATGKRDYCVELQAMIINDAGTILHPIRTTDPASGFGGGTLYFSDVNTITLWRLGSGLFDQFAYSAAGNRGIVIAWYSKTAVH